MTTRPPAAHICHGEVVHKRVQPVEHRLAYKVFSLLLDVDQFEETASGLRLFKLDGFGLFSLRQKDHGYRDTRSIAQFAWETVRKAGLEGNVSDIRVLLYPRILGFAFNPLTVYFCCDQDGAPQLMIYEVRNTFGEALTYVVPAGDAKNGTYSHKADKQFYVSPFNAVEGDYTFHVDPPDLTHHTSTLTVGVALKVDDRPLLRTHFRGDTTPLTDRALLKAFFTYPLMTLKIVAGIHIEAAHLWRKGMRLVTRPKGPKGAVVIGKSSPSHGTNVSAEGHS